MHRRPLLSLFLLVVCLAGGSIGPVQRDTKASKPLPQGVDREWWSTVRAKLEAEAYAVRALTDAADGAIEADNPRQQFRTRFTAMGVAITPASRASHTSLASIGLRLSAYGAADRLIPVAPVAPRAVGSRVEFQYGDVTEWYVNQSRGVEQGFTVAARPAGDGPLMLELAVSGAARPELQDDGRRIELRGSTSASRLHYSNLYVFDATGRTLSSRMTVPETGDARIQLVVDASDAVYPLTVDPLISTPATTLDGDTGEGLGDALASAGDVNGDGYSDVVVAASSFDSQRGRVHVYHGGAAGLSTTAAVTLDGENEFDQFGWAVATAGDVNNDGYADIIVGAPGVSVAYLYYGSPAGIQAAGATPLDVGAETFGWSVASAGDVNGDGYSDVVVGAPIDDFFTGFAAVFHGGSGGLSSTAATTLVGDDEFEEFGWSVASAGDVNADGYADVVVGSTGFDCCRGRVQVYHGSASGLSAAAPTIVEGEAQANRFGFSVAPAGDVNGDGYADVIVGAPEYPDGDANGRAYLFPGGAGGMATSAATTIDGDNPGDGLGNIVTSAGDVNGDGFADVAVAVDGDAHIYEGSASGLSGAPAPLLSPEYVAAMAFAGDVNGDGFGDLVVADSLSGGAGRVLIFHGSPAVLAATAVEHPNPVPSGELLFGNDSATADVNGDGYADLIVGSPSYSSNTGRVYVFAGSATGPSTTAATTLTGAAASYFGRGVASAGDVNGDGYQDILIGASDSVFGGRVRLFLGSASGLTSAAAASIQGSYDLASQNAAAAGDVNGDGYGDVVLSSGMSGSAWVYHGGPSGISATADTTLIGETTDEWFGDNVSSGDVNADGFADIIVAAPRFDSYRGRVFVYHGSAGGLVITPAIELQGVSASDLFGTSVASAGDVNGDGYADLVVSVRGVTSNVNVYLGSVAGIVSPAATTITSTPPLYLGGAVASAGDVNGDGYADVAVGGLSGTVGAERAHAFVYLGGAGGVSTTEAFATDVESGVVNSSLLLAMSYGDLNGDGYADLVFSHTADGIQGRTYTHYGNGGLGRSVTPRMRRANDTAPLADGGRAGHTAGFRLAALGHSPLGRTRLKLEWEVKPVGMAFDGTGTSLSADWVNPALAGASFNELVSDLIVNTQYHWRARVRYHPADRPFAPFSRWITQPIGSWEDAAVTARLNVVPSALSVSFTGTLRTGQLLTGVYSYVDPEGDPEASTFRWLRNGAPIPDATAITYTTVPADSGQTITFEVTPRASAGTTPGSAVASTGALILNTAPTATAVSLSGTPKVGQLLTGHYTYADIDLDVEGTSTFRWLIDGFASSTTTSTYTITVDDLGRTITFEVTPTAATGDPVGAPVISSGVVVLNSAPTATPVEISGPGTRTVGDVLDGSYVFSDIDMDLPGISTFRWLRNGTPIPGATASNYTTVAADYQTTLIFEVTPVAATGTLIGTPATSSGVAIDAVAPVITGNPNPITTAIGQMAYFNAGASGQPWPDLQWQVSTDRGATFSNVPGATSNDYEFVVALADHGKRFRAVFTNVAGTATTTAAMLSVPGPMMLSRSHLNFGANRPASTITRVTPTQTVEVTFTGGASSFSVSTTAPWLDLDYPAEGTFSVRVVPSLVPAGAASYSASVVVSSLAAPNSPLTIPVLLNIYVPGAPFGSFDTPAAGAAVSGSIPVTGWALDDVLVTKVEIWRDRAAGETTAVNPGPGPGTGKIYIADATFVTGARPDIESGYPTLPMDYRGGWGYLLLTYGLFNQGTGSFTLYAFAYDADGRATTLGTKTITSDNATATKPFGNIDTPGFGQTVSGSVWNFGWALTPNATPSCTIVNGNVYVSIDSGPLVAVNYGDHRPDIAAGFPGYTNSAGAGGAYYLDTTTLTNGTHQIGWYVVDNCGRAEGIGSRFFNVFNADSTGDSSGAAPPVAAAATAVSREPVIVRRTADIETIWPDALGDHVVPVGQSERIEVRLPSSAEPYAAAQVINGERRPLPLGSSLDAAQGIFYWQPDAAFLGAHDLEFVSADHIVRVRVVIGSSVQAVIDLPQAGPVSSQFMIAGWAIDQGAASGTGIDTVHAWAYPAGGGAPIFLGVAQYGDARWDIGALFGDRFTNASYGLVVNGTLGPGDYEIVVYPYSTVTGTFSGAKTVNVRVQ